MTTWPLHVEEWQNCQRCPLAQQRSSTCLGRSEWPQGADRPNLRLPCEVLFVGEAPGMSEDTSGYPFVGPAGQRLDQIIEVALGPKVTVALTNLVACFPRVAKMTGDHRPERGEVLECRQRLVEFVNIAQPHLIVRVGDMVTQYMNFDLTVPYVDIYHPAWILRQVAARQQSATQNCIAQVRNAYMTVVQSRPIGTWKPWGLKGLEDAKAAKTTRGQLSILYDEADEGITWNYRPGGPTYGEDDIPF